MPFKDATEQEIDQVMQEAWKAFMQFRKTTLKQRADLMRTIGVEMEAIGDELIHTVMEETHLPEARVKNERARTIFQLTSYAAACEAGHWLEARIDTANPEKGDPDIRKMQVPLGPVVVFGASNFPFAYSTAGGDTASALAAGCPVVVKAHPAHSRTSELVAGAILRAVEKCGMPKGVFAHVHGASFETGKALVTHPHTRAVGFTGSYGGGKALFDWANQRKAPIPVFAEMGSINPIFLLPGKLKQSAKETAALCAGSITLGTGQFCTNPGLIVGIDNEDLQVFIKELGAAIAKTAPGTMLHAGIAKAYGEKRKAALQQQEVETVSVSEMQPQQEQGVPTIASATAKAFFSNPLLHQEVFGPYSLVIRCADAAELLAVATHLEGQLTCTMMATAKDIKEHTELVDLVQDICGRLIHNGVPTGVRVALSMQHGGPFPATTDSRFTSVGADGIKRWVRPLSFQNWEDDLLPDAVKNGNPLGIWRMVNDQLSNGALA
ncbi:aldehyde dehydrogenase (NADP(+)) [Flavitalea sp. BT771]|uniref:aldehyde dehydrogenase (NADP(+)) n=1 Tax=Flavitalea sp. BT771 TaxID=3063329 RepID=UPI0026E11C03|nr:aldehyde dehydrogenase (NADP(+)) [Flavitalea sp. BT771]MDO6434556.1 aldehyde dehydrogenase (NADP(+)) [Flavitalea sp. BT771]MDV6223456.1 aldehyde dehydrogenase (NADP(+)) [Flavitalea sp. BT771]